MNRDRVIPLAALIALGAWTAAAMTPPLAQADRVHLTAAGYRLVADALYEELRDGYAEFVKQKNGSPGNAEPQIDEPPLTTDH